MLLCDKVRDVEYPARRQAGLGSLGFNAIRVNNVHKEMFDEEMGY